jgi:adenosylcobinamide-phosphate synthase
MRETINAYIQQLHGYLMDPDRFPVAIAAFIIVTLIGIIRGPLGGNAYPFYWHIVDVLFGGIGGRMDKSSRPKGDLIFRGFVMSAIVLAISYLVGRFLGVMAFYYPDYSIVEILALCLLLSSGAVWASLGRLYRALNEKKVTEGAYYNIARSTRSNMGKSDDYTITRIGMGLGLKAYDKGIVAPVIWYLIAGLPGAYLYAGLAAMSWRFGRDGHSGGFGQAPLALERLMGYIPNILSGLFVALAGLLTPTAGMSRAFKGFFASKGKASYEEGGFPVTTAAYSLDVALGGPTTDLDGFTIKRNWVGPEKATAQLGAKHLHRVVYICFMAHLLFLLSLCMAMLFAENGPTLGFLPL